MAFGAIRRRGRWLSRVVVTVVLPVVVLVLVVGGLWQVNGALARDDVRVYPVALICGDERMPLELPGTDDVNDGTPIGPVLEATLKDTSSCRVFVQVANEGRWPVRVRSADLPDLAASNGRGGYWQSTRDWSGRRAQVVDQDARYRLSETIEPGEAWTWSFVLQHRPGTTLCEDLVLTQQLPRLNLSVYGARGSELGGVWVRTRADEPVGANPSRC